jgi:MATE family multidrug resistance protein
VRSEIYHKTAPEFKESPYAAEREEREERVFRLKILKCARETVKLAFPVVIARLGTVGMNLVDTIMVGRYGTQDLAYQSLANTVAVFLLAVSLGLIQGTIVMTANAFGRGMFRECGAVLRRSIPYGAKIGIFLMILCMPSEFLMKLLGQPEDVAEGSARVLSIYALGIPAALMFYVMSSFLEGTKRPLPGMIMIILANILNIFLNWALVYGHYGFPEMGAAGSAVSTTVIRWFLAIGMFICVFCIDENDIYGVWEKPKPDSRESKKLHEIGYGAAVTMGVEEGAFSAINIMVGWLGALALGAFTIILNISNIIFMIATGIGTASSVLVGIARGRKSVLDMRIAGWMGTIMNLFMMAACSVVLVFWPKQVASIYTLDPELIQLCIPMVMLCSLICIVDGTQVVMVNILRGAVDIFIPTVGQAIAFIGLMIPLVWLFSFRMGIGVLGSVYGMIAASTFAASFLLLRFYFLCRRYQRDGFVR